MKRLHCYFGASLTIFSYELMSHSALIGPADILPPSWHAPLSLWKISISLLFGVIGYYLSHKIYQMMHEARK